MNAEFSKIFDFKSLIKAFNNFIDEQKHRLTLPVNGNSSIQEIDKEVEMLNHIINNAMENSMKNSKLEILLGMSLDIIKIIIRRRRLRITNLNDYNTSASIIKIADKIIQEKLGFSKKTIMKIN